MLNNELVPTRSALLELRAEQDAIEEAYDFLDEKRLMLAAETIQQMSVYQDLLEQLEQLHRDARETTQKVVYRHGLRGGRVYPADDETTARVSRKQRNYMGVTLVEMNLELGLYGEAPLPSNPSPEARECKQIYKKIILLNANMAAISGNIQRLLREYQRTQRRARALENVVIPELQSDVQTMTISLEEMDQEEVVRVHMHLSG